MGRCDVGDVGRGGLFYILRGPGKDDILSWHAGGSR